jgi:hypothetical protein
MTSEKTDLLTAARDLERMLGGEISIERALAMIRRLEAERDACAEIAVECWTDKTGAKRFSAPVHAPDCGDDCEAWTHDFKTRAEAVAAVLAEAARRGGA